MSQHLFQLLLKKGLTPNQHYVLWCCSNKIRCSLPSMEGEARILKVCGFLDDEHNPTPKGVEVLTETDALFRKTKPIAGPDLIGEGYMERIKEYRSKFPVGKKGDQEEVVNKIARLIYKNPTVTIDTILQATDLYLSEVSEQKYTMKAGNFIEKDGAHAIMEYIERITDGESTEDFVPMFKAV